MLALSLYSCTALTCIGLGRSWCISTGTEFFLNRFRWVACVGTRGRTSLHPLFLSCAFLFLLFFVYLFVFCGSIWHLLPRKYRIYIYILLGCFSLFASYPDRVCCSFILLWLSNQCLIFITSLSVSSSCCFCSRGQVRWVELSWVELSRPQAALCSLWRFSLVWHSSVCQEVRILWSGTCSSADERQAVAQVHRYHSHCHQ